jgi:hypothetical protein
MATIKPRAPAKRPAAGTFKPEAALVASAAALVAEATTDGVEKDRGMGTHLEATLEASAAAELATEEADAAAPAAPDEAEDLFYGNHHQNISFLLETNDRSPRLTWRSRRHSRRWNWRSKRRHHQ